MVSANCNACMEDVHLVIIAIAVGREGIGQVNEHIGGDEDFLQGCVCASGIIECNELHVP